MNWKLEDELDALVDRRGDWDRGLVEEVAGKKGVVQCDSEFMFYSLRRLSSPLGHKLLRPVSTSVLGSLP